MPVTMTQISDFMNSVRAAVEPGMFADLSTQLQARVAVDEILLKNKRKEIKSHSYQYQALTGGNGQTAAVSLDTPDSSTIVDKTLQATIYHRQIRSSWSVHKALLAANSNTKEQLFEYGKLQYQMGMIDLYEKMETWFWGFTTSTDTQSPFGIPNLIVKNATEGFSGVAPSGYTDVCGITPGSTLVGTKWNNYTAQYTAADDGDLGAKLRRAVRFTNFQAIVPGMSRYGGNQIRRGIYTNYDGMENVKNLCKSQEESIGWDIDAADNKPMLNRTKFTDVPALDSDSTNPYYGIDWNTLFVTNLTGFWMNQSPEVMPNGAHLMVTKFIDTFYNLATLARRNNFVIATGTTGVRENSAAGYVYVPA